MKSFKLLVILIITVELCNFVYAQEIKMIKLNTNENRLTILASLDTPVPDEIIDLLKNGVKITIVYYIQILEERPFWLIYDKTIYKKDVEKIVTYNIWEKTFYLKEGKNLYKIKNVEELQRRLMNINNIRLISLKQIKKKKNLYIRVKAKLESIKLFPPLSWIYDLVITRSFETSWKIKKIK